jgi:F-type H+-transporting ATPase subunit b
MLIGKFNAAYLVASSGAASPFDDSVDLAIWTLIVFVGLLLVLGKFAWKPIIEGLNAREKSIADNIDSASQANEQAQAQLKSYEDKLAGAGDEAAALIAEAKQDAVAAKEKIMEEAAAEAQRTRDRAMADIEAAKNSAVQELAKSSVDSAVDLAGSIVGRSLDKKDHAELIEKSIKQFSSGV